MILKRRKAYNRGKPWSEIEEDFIINHLKNGRLDLHSFRQKFPDRTLPAIRSKVRKLRIKYDLFGSSYREEKSEFTKIIANRINPKIVFDAYAGVGHQSLMWIEKAKIVFASEKIEKNKVEFNSQLIQAGFKKWKRKYKVWDKYTKGEKVIYFFLGDAIEALSHIKVENKKIDIVDLDTCGSTLPSLPIFLSILRPKHLVITHGEFHSLRFGREDVLKRILAHRDLGTINLPMNIDELANELDKAVKLYGIRAHNEIKDSFWLKLKDEIWLGQKNNGMLRRYYLVLKPPATSDCINIILENNK